MSLFSERYGYTKPSDVIIRERITPEIQNAICSCFDRMERKAHYDIHSSYYADLQKYLWTEFLYQREAKFDYRMPVATAYLEDKTIQWYAKLDLIDKSIEYLVAKDIPYVRYFIADLNREFKQLHFAYRIVDNQIVEITSKEEIKSIEDAISNNDNPIRTHFQAALQLYAKRPEGDFRNSIKESISAVEVFCRDKTGEETLGKALKRWEKSEITIPQILNTAFDKLYAYTNQPDTGIRHALMDSSATYTPSSAEALFMLVACSAFINYLEMKEGLY